METERVLSRQAVNSSTRKNHSNNNNNNGTAQPIVNTNFIFFYPKQNIPLDTSVCIRESMKKFCDERKKREEKNWMKNAAGQINKLFAIEVVLCLMDVPLFDVRVYSHSDCTYLHADEHTKKMNHLQMKCDDDRRR